MKKVFFSILGISIVFCFIYISKQPHIHFKYKEIHLSLNEDIEPYDYIEEIENIDIEKLEIKNNVNIQKLGEYEIQYCYEGRVFRLKVYIDDTLPPEFETVNVKILRHQTILPEKLVKNIQDDSKTIVYFKEDYIFNEVKTYRVCVVVEDAYENRTEKNAYVLVEDRDREAPTITGLAPLTILVGDKVDYRKNIVVSDDHDKNPILTIDDTHVDISQKGEYILYYHIKDNSGNENIYERQIKVYSQYDNRESLNDGKKVCYLTFDDGPSSNTEEILKILDDYHIKATFFVTGTSPKHFQYIKQAYQKGHAIGLHTYSHDYEYIYSSMNNYLRDLDKIKEVVYQQIGIYPQFIRFPGGSSNKVSKKYNIGIMKRLTRKVIDLGYQYYDWTSINGDGEGIKSVKGLTKKAFQEMEGYEDIMFLMHDSASCDGTVKALPAILDELIKRGYQFEIVEKYSPTFHHTIHN